MSLPFAAPRRHEHEAWIWQPSAEMRRAGLALITLGGLALMTFLAAVLATRKFVGALKTPLSPARLAVVACALVVAGLIVRWSMRRAGGFQLHPTSAISISQSIPGWLLLLFPTALLGVWAWAVTLPGTSRFGLFVLYVPLIVEECWSIGTAWKARSLPGSAIADAPGPRRTDSREPASPQRPLADSTAAVAEVWARPPLPVEVSQQLTRSRTPDGRDECRGFVRASFAAGQRTEIVHLAFCPPFPVTPDWTAEPIEGPPVSIKHVQLFPYGVRLEVRLDSLPRQPVMSLVRFAAIERREKSASEATGG